MKKIIAVLVGLFAALGTIGSPEPEADKGAVVRILTPPGIELRGRSEVETLAIDPEIREIVVFVDGEEAARRGRPPWNVKVVLADPPREQTVEVKAYGDRGRELGSDRVVVNRERDRAFLVDFDEQLRLAHGLTGDLGELYEALDALEPEGGTALYDSILFSLLQFEAQPGRRALVVLTDGYDSRSTTDERHAVEFGRKLGVPVYVVALPSGGGPGDVAVHALKLVTDPTGGRLLRVGSAGGLERAFAQIAAELRHQYVLTCYTDELPGDGRRKITVRLKDRKDVEVRAVFAWDQMS